MKRPSRRAFGVATHRSLNYLSWGNLRKKNAPEKPECFVFPKGRRDYSNDTVLSHPRSIFSIAKVKTLEFAGLVATVD